MKDFLINAKSHSDKKNKLYAKAFSRGYNRGLYLVFFNGQTGIMYSLSL